MNMMPSTHNIEAAKTRTEETKSRREMIEMMGKNFNEMVDLLGANLSKPGFIDSREHIEMSNAIKKMADVMYA